MNFLAILGAALIPMLVGFIWYNPKVFGNAWMKVAGKTEEELAQGNMAVILGVSYLLSILLAFGLSGMTNHQSGVEQLFAMHPDFGQAGTETQNLFEAVMAQFGNTHRTFGHGVIHGVIASVIIALPLIAINALFERRGGKYIGIHFGYWLITLALMGGVVCQFL